ncbi:hypothetical protein [Paraburkholderia sp. GAS32]|uniref:hypothetical protein n=1 Tax=Paraburkholderia sp. GAS32 TaxID=3035129 RepID=UPI003D1E26A9
MENHIQRIVISQQIFNKQFFTGPDRPERVDEESACGVPGTRRPIGGSTNAGPSCRPPR